MCHAKPSVLLSVALLLSVRTTPTVQAQKEETSADLSMPFQALARRVQFVSVDAFNQFRYADNKPRSVTARDDYYKFSTTVRVSLEREGRTYVHARGESGRSFASSYDYAGIGMRPGYWSFNLKSLFLGQKVGPHLELQGGALEFGRGAGTEATYADNDGWLEGYRVVYTPNPRHWAPDVVGVTVGYTGDFRQPNAFARLSRMGEENYIQIAAGKHLGYNRQVSGEYDSIQGVRYTREAVHLQNLHLVVLDELIAEAIARGSDRVRFGWSGSLFKRLHAKSQLRAGMFISDMPEDIFLKNKSVILMNGDFYVAGQRVGPVVRIVPLKNLDLTLMASARSDNTAGMRYRGQVTVCYHFADVLNRLLH
jgi:hypothetical protein